MPKAQVRKVRVACTSLPAVPWREGKSSLIPPQGCPHSSCKSKPSLQPAPTFHRGGPDPPGWPRTGLGWPSWFHSLAAPGPSCTGCTGLFCSSKGRFSCGDGEAPSSGQSTSGAPGLSSPLQFHTLTEGRPAQAVSKHGPQGLPAMSQSLNGYQS